MISDAIPRWAILGADANVFPSRMIVSRRALITTAAAIAFALVADCRDDARPRRSDGSTGSPRSGDAGVSRGRGRIVLVGRPSRLRRCAFDARRVSARAERRTALAVHPARERRSMDPVRPLRCAVGNPHRRDDAVQRGGHQAWYGSSQERFSRCTTLRRLDGAGGSRASSRRAPTRT